jgi:hypothetical protein
MTPRRSIDVEHEEAKRRLRAEAARLRRRIDRHLTGVSSETARLMSWQTYVKRYPLATLSAAFGVGLAVSAGISRSNWKRWLAGKLFSTAVAGVKAGMLSDIIGAWQQSRNGRSAAEPFEAAQYAAGPRSEV